MLQRFLLAISALIVTTAGADKIYLVDGRVFEGLVIREGQEVVADTVIANIRTRLTLKASDIDRIERAPVPDDFFDVPEGPTTRDVDDDGGIRYLEVPIQGRLGEQVFARGVYDALRHARRNKVRHIVFTIDSDGGDGDEAALIYDYMKRYSNDLTYHAVVRDCLGGALAVVVWCDTVVVRPGGRIGGGLEVITSGDGETDALQQQVVRSQIAYEVGAEAERRGRDADIIRAMIDPREQVAVWMVDGELAKGVRAPADVSPEDVIIANGPDKVLTLSDQQLHALGVDTFEGTLDELGALYELDAWQAESDFGRRALLNAASSMQRRETANQLKFEQAVQENIAHREKTMRYIDHNLQQAAEWDPGKGDYAQYGSVFRWNWGRGRVGRTGSRTWTQESRRDWLTRTDATIIYLQKAQSGMRTMKKLDTEAAKLGLEPTLDNGEIDLWLTDIRMKLTVLNDRRNRRGD